MAEEKCGLMDDILEPGWWSLDGVKGMKPLYRQCASKGGQLEKDRGWGGKSGFELDVALALEEMRTQVGEKLLCASTCPSLPKGPPNLALMAGELAQPAPDALVRVPGLLPAWKPHGSNETWLSVT